MHKQNIHFRCGTHLWFTIDVSQLNTYTHGIESQYTNLCYKVLHRQTDTDRFIDKYAYVYTTRN